MKEFWLTSFLFKKEKDGSKSVFIWLLLYDTIANFFHQFARPLIFSINLHM